MTPESLFFLQPEAAVHKRYEALRSFYVEGMTAREVSAKFGYTVSTVYALARDFKKLLISEQPSSKFFIRPQPGRKEKSLDGSTGKLIVELRKKYLSVSEIKAILDFYKDAGGEELKYLVFDSKFTTYQNLSNLDDAGIKFLTIRRRGKNIVERIKAIPDSEKRKVRVPAGDGKKRLLTVLDEVVFLKDYGDNMRQISISGSRKVKPALIITNDFNLSVEEVVRKYARRWLVEKIISEQIEFFHLNKISSSMVIKVDFDLTISILTHNLYRIFASDLEGYSHSTPQTLYQKFIHNSGQVKITDHKIIVQMKKKRHLPTLLTSMERFQAGQIRWLGEKELVFQGASIS